MAQVRVKYKCGQEVSCSGIQGKVTALFIRGRGRAYEFSYIDSNGNPTNAVCGECELEAVVENKLGFNGKD